MSYHFFQQKLSQLFTFLVIQLAPWYMPPKIIMNCTFHLGSCNCHNPWRMHGTGILYFTIHLPAKNQLNEGNIYQPSLFLMLATSCYPLFCCAQKNRTKKMCVTRFSTTTFLSNGVQDEIVFAGSTSKIGRALCILLAKRGNTAARTSDFDLSETLTETETNVATIRGEGIKNPGIYKAGELTPYKTDHLGLYALRGKHEFASKKLDVFFFRLSGEVSVSIFLGKSRMYHFVDFYFMVLDISNTSFCWWFFTPDRKKTGFA